MTERDHFRRLIDIVGAVLQRPPDEREAELERACGDDTALLDEARSLLAQAQTSSLARVTREIEQRIQQATAAAGSHPGHIGPYRILDVLGEGGMGVVYRAEQTEPIRREVAIKIVRGGRYGERARARFDLERQALARMDHPCIAAIYDAGSTEDGLPYFVMELVRGDALTSYCDSRSLNLDARLALFADVCRGVQHAHVRGLIHRDLKPANILVADVDGRPAPRIIDFGIARVVEDATGAETMHTAQGAMVGTLEYMSPEQAIGGAAPVDTRSDIYSLGVILYELLTGTLPFDSEALRGATPAEVRRILLDADPPTPSRRLTTVESRQSVASKRSTDERSLYRHVRGDLDWIVMRAIEKDPARRYQSASELAEDIDRFRHHQPVAAAPPTRRYRTARFVQRHRVGVLAVSGAAVALLAGTTLATIGMVKAQDARRHAELEAKRAETTSKFITDMLAQARPEISKGREVTVREVLDKSANDIEKNRPFAGDPEVAASIRHAIGESYSALADYDRALPFFKEALEMRRRALGPDDPKVASTLDRMGNAMWQSGDLQGSLRCAQEVMAIRERTVGKHSPDYSTALINVGNTYADMGDYARAEPMLREALALDRELLGNDNADLAFSLNNLATILVDEGKYADAIPLHQESLALRRKFFGEPSAEVSIALANLGYAMALNGDDSDAETTLRQAVAMSDSVYGPTHQRTAVCRARLAIPLLHTGHPKEAEQLLRGAIADYIASADERSWRVGDFDRWLAEALIAQGRGKEGDALLETAWSILSETQGADRPLAREVAGRLAERKRVTGDMAGAARWQAHATAAPR
ncbi:MAG TPA: serine/threonine-protein kinase [Candidatus Krumholzibacteria bacterium]|nr:serine/threonine-protein kinase [Candidatus Krumholzibacteria bacterium]